jgi:hypothetical protein
MSAIAIDNTQMSNPYHETTMKIFARCSAEASAADWELSSMVGDIALQHKKFNDAPIPAYRCSTSVQNSLHSDLVKAIWDINEDKIKNIDSSILNWEVLESYPDCRVIRQVLSMGPKFLVWPRESILVQAVIRQQPDQTWYVSYSLDEHKSVPLDEKNYVRGKCVFNTLGFVKNGNDTVIHKVILADPCGNIPASVITMFSHKTVQLLNYVKDYAKTIKQ